MDRKIRYAQFGVGRMGALIIKFALEHGADVVCAFDANPAIIGKDAGAAAGIDPIGVTIDAIGNAPARLKECRPDIALIATQGSMEAVMPIFRVCAAAGVNALTIAEWALYPWTADPEYAKGLDELGKRYGVTLASSSGTEISWGTLAGGTDRVDKIRIEGCTSLEQYGPAGASQYPHHGVGFTMEEYEKKFGSAIVEETDGHWPCLSGDQNGFLCALMGLHPVRQYARYVPLTYREDVYSANLGRVIPAGDLLGMTLTITTETQEGIVVEFALGGKVFTPEDESGFRVILSGDPDWVFRVEAKDQSAGPVETCSTTLNHIPDVLNAPPGLLLPHQYCGNHYRSHPYHEYVTAELGD